MIHRIRLSPLIRKCLGDVVALQMSLLAYAASSTTLNEGECARHLGKDPRFKGREAAIAKWLWGAPNRIGPLVQFSSGPGGGKRVLSRLARREAIRLLRGRTGKLTPWSGSAPPWMAAAAEFLIRFYTDLCGPSGLPASIFSTSVATGRFNRQQFFEAFEAINPGLEICAICDETAFLTKPPGTYRGELDHYFPKSSYPHLSCHPFNLVPTCHFCNGQIKLSRDPLEVSGRRYRLEDIFVPYRGECFAERAFLKIQARRLESAVFEGLSARRGQTLRQAPESFEATYKVPSRWRAQSKRIGEKIFRTLKRRISHMIFPAAPSEQVREMVRQVDITIGESWGDQGVDAYGFAIVWWLAKLSEEQLIPMVLGKQRQSSFWVELSGFIKNTSLTPQYLSGSKEDERRGQRIRQEVG